jgi:hypothetical protein
MRGITGARGRKGIDDGSIAGWALLELQTISLQASRRDHIAMFKLADPFFVKQRKKRTIPPNTEIILASISHHIWQKNASLPNSEKPFI